MVKPFWDLEEQKGYKKIKSRVNGRRYRVLNQSRQQEASDNLGMVQDRIDGITNILRTYPCLWFGTRVHDGIEVFLNIHGGNYDLIEMPEGTHFDGLNKPRNVSNYGNRVASVGPDGTKRARDRLIYLQLRKQYFGKNSDSFRSNKSLMNLVIHEISHTAANHVTWREDDHGADFKLYEDFLKTIYNPNTDRFVSNIRC
tara:strand:+ start:88 stop:684 length:597 start_codon:yes stop_codon:yes gene_type:complete